MAETHHHAKKIDRQQEVDAERIGIRNQIAEQRPYKRFKQPADIDREAQAHIPGKADLLPRLGADFNLGILWINQ